ncbi:MFS transporter [Microbacterium sp. zg-YB36]|uniref:MFS transporter n=1 Tax=Microbacterium sp. zg-YB36 TaxID=2969407 RepID=UPI00214BA590|nr:MFS transporter [Microbacterium sp. zg-YB36]MDL5351481.1 MFS transporter [Microbacterium sp. zg-YB36]
MKPETPVWMPDFRRIWGAQGAAVLADEIGELAIPLLAVLTLHASAADLGLLGVARWAPFLILALPLGVLVDRLRRRPLLMTANVVRAVVITATAIIAASGGLSMPLLIALVGIVGCGLVLFEVATPSFLPAVVPVAFLPQANARLQATTATMQVGGPGIGGALVQLLTAPAALCATAVGYAASAIALARVRVPETPGQSTPFLRALRDGLAFVRADRYLVANLGFSAIYNPFSQWVMVLLPLHAVATLGLDAAAIGLVFAVGAAGAVLGAMCSAAVVRRWGAGRPLMWCAAVECVVLLGLPVVERSWGTVAVIAALGGILAVNGACTALSSVILVTIRQYRSPDRILGRVNASMRWLTYGTVALGSAAGGFVGEAIGTRGAMTIGAILCLGTIVWVALSPLPRIGDPAELAVVSRR